MNREPIEIEHQPAGLALTLSFLRDYPERSVVIPVLGSALAEPLARAAALEQLLAAPEPRAAREIVRGFHRLPERERRSAFSRRQVELIAAARQLLGSDRLETRASVAELADCIVAWTPERLADAIPLLLVLFDDPRPEVAKRSRLAFVHAVLQVECPATRGVTPRSPVLQGLVLLLERWPSHRELQVIRALFAVGPYGADAMGRAIAQQSAACEAIRQVAEEPLGSGLSSGPVSDAAVLDARIDGVIRWLDHPNLQTREFARGVLRRRADAPFLLGVCRRIASLEAGREGREYPVFRHMRWECLEPEHLEGLPAATLQRIASYLAAGAANAQQAAGRVARLLCAAGAEARLPLLRTLKEIPAAPPVEALEVLLDDADPQVQLATLELLGESGERRACLLIVRQLRSAHEAVRELAQRKLTGRALTLFFDSCASLGETERRAVLPVLRKVDGSFGSQLRRALRAAEEETIVRALRTVRDLDDASEFADSLIDLTVNPSPRVRATLARALRGLPAEPRAHYLRLLLDDQDPRVIANAAETLGEVAGVESMAWLGALRDHEAARVRTNVLLALARLGDPAAREQLELVAGSKSAEPAARAGADWALGQLHAAVYGRAVGRAVPEAEAADGR